MYFCRPTRIAVTRAQVCQYAHDNNKTMLSFDTGVTGSTERAITIYFQILFCSILGVKILNPFATMSHVKELHSIPWKQRYQIQIAHYSHFYY
jgi:hypothetical protein